MDRNKDGQLSKGTIALLSLATAVVYFLSNPKPHNFYDYTYRVAGNLLRGGIAFTEKPPSWLNEMVPFEGVYYAVFPLGAVLSMIPAALLGSVGIITEMPGAWIAAVLAGVTCYFLLRITSFYNVSNSRKLVQVLGILLGTFMWTNLTFAGAWQLALGFALVGELGAIYFTVYDRRPLLAGFFFAMAFGNRTEILLTAPVFMYLLMRVGDNRGDAETRSEETKAEETKGPSTHVSTSLYFPSSLRLSVSAVNIRSAAMFCVIPVVLGIATLIYNYVRFHSFTDFGYARIPGVLDEPWYDRGIFSFSYLTRQAWEMLFRSWERYPTFPYLRPNGFSSTIVWSSPFLLYIFRTELPAWLQQRYRRFRRTAREKSVDGTQRFPSLYSIFTFRADRDKTLKYAAWAAIVILTVLLWTHGNSGGWQFGYRYAMVLLPWVFVLLLESAPKHITFVEGTGYAISFVTNLYATWLYHWTDYMKP
ncbi:MAG: hypothetical protein ABIV21_08345 [Pyrinomonadaceae bacterium]